MGITFGGKAVLDPKNLVRICGERGLPTQQFVGKANRMGCPAGRGPGRGAILLNSSDFDALDLTQSFELIFDDGTRPPAKFQKIQPIRITCILPGADSDPNGRFLVELADRRYHLFRIPIDAAYNVRSSADGSYVDDTLNSGTAWTWDELAEDIWNTVGSANIGTYPSLPFTPDGTPEGFEFYGMSAWDALNDVMGRIGCVMIYDPFGDSFSIGQAGTATDAGTAAVDACTNADAELVWDTYGYDIPRAIWPEKLRVLFRTTPGVAEGESPWTAEDVALTAPDPAGVVTGTFEIIFDDLYATGTNGAALTARSAERAADWTRIHTFYTVNRVQMSQQIRIEAAKCPVGSVGGWLMRDNSKGLQTEIGPGDYYDYKPPGPSSDGGVPGPPGTDGSFWGAITGSNAAGEPATIYSWKKVVLDPTTKLYVDASPTVTGSLNLKRAPSNVVGVLPLIPTDQVVRIWPSPTVTGWFECPAHGGQIGISFDITTYSWDPTTCVMTPSTTTINLTGRDLVKS